MEFIGYLIVGVLVLGFAAFALGLVVFLFSILTGATSSTATPLSGAGNSSMNEGDFHSGPEGYSLQTLPTRTLSMDQADMTKGISTDRFSIS